ncbi:SurA N-terminal domain-containing protein [Marivirga sp. S37H4]|uniref:Periplasmic chaperone PpiD n=1 Tax=Marivirga aurantiaca TaxID=2802615 RepID=A0A934WZ41_9BACT|nr:SurA N-terminal domain-containing protein [Marivirga aurantiaca]MBK6265547.1 SurA N-terminal domain-containing protein [Marivirga aurantiaca]
MGVFNTLRVKMGSVLIILIGFSILAFLMTDLLGPDSRLLGGGGGSNNVGEIAGENISMEQYQQQVEEFKYNFQANNGRTPSDSEMNSLRQQAWDYLIIKIAFQEQYDELGLQVTNEELVDMVQGDNISPIVRQNFTDPQTGEFNKEQVVNIIRNIAQAPAEQQSQWYSFEASLLPARKRTKYDELLISSTYVTSVEAERAYRKENATVELDYLYIPYTSISDSLVTPTEDRLKSYYNEHKEDYETEATRSIKYVAFELLPSAEDSLFIRKEMESMKEEFKEVEQDSSFARANTDRRNAFRAYPIAELPKILASNTNILKEGDVMGPYIENNAYTLYKVSEIYDDSLYSARASHILIKAEGEESDEDAKARANDVLQKALAGQDFGELAKEYSKDPSATKGGDLGWFKEGRMVEEFDKAVFEKSGTGVINKVVKTNFGYHIIKVTEEKTAKTYKIATIEREILPSESTRDQVFRKADFFAGSNENYKEFQAAAEVEGYNIRESGKMTTDQRSIGNLGNAREIVRWAFTDAKLNKVSSVFEVSDYYVVAVLTNKSDEGVASFEEVKPQITREVKKELQAEKVKERLASLSGSLDEIAEAYGNEARVNSTADLKLADNSLQSVGQAPEIIGRAFGMEEGQVSEPLEAKNGIVILKVLSKTPAGEIADYAAYKEQIAQRRKNSASFKIKAAIEANADIVDERYKFY